MNMFEKITPEEAGISSDRIAEYISRLDRRGAATHSMIMMKGDRIFAEYYWAPFNKDFNHRMYSMTKSFVGIAIGLLIEEGKLSLDDRIVDIMADRIVCEQPTEICEQTVRDMLTMRTAGNTAYWWFYGGESDRAKVYFAPRKYYRPSGTVWGYDTDGSQLLGEVVEKLSGMSLFDYLNEKIFRHMGMFKDAEILKVANGASWGDSAMICTARELAAFARLLMKGGEWEGKQLVSREYVKEATSAVVDNRTDAHILPYSHGYGYQIWRFEGGGYGFVGMGMQYAICYPEKDLLFVINSDNQGNDLLKPQIVYGFIDSILENMQDKPLKPNKAAEKRLAKVTRDLKLTHVKGLSDSPLRDEINGKKFICDQNEMGIKSFSFKFYKNGTGVWSYVNAQGKKSIKFGLNKNVFGKFPELGYSNERGGVKTTDGFMYDDAVSACFTHDRKLIMKVQIIDRYFGNMSAVFAFKGKRAACLFTKTAEAFMDEYQGRMNATMIE